VYRVRRDVDMAFPFTVITWSRTMSRTAFLPGSTSSSPAKLMPANCTLCWLADRTNRSFPIRPKISPFTRSSPNLNAGRWCGALLRCGFPGDGLVPYTPVQTPRAAGRGERLGLWVSIGRNDTRPTPGDSRFAPLLPGNLRPVLEAESRVWNERLRWDFQASANLLLQIPGLPSPAGLRCHRERPHLRLRLLCLRE